ncbi:hypothetical protein LTR37_006828 [Vermiconidia calcicola]|uniref:Uncharacterized protein n=1 Tax=Vermiconidia calcicola TaxID=1690605 RepID=A0ACC3NFF5_9PEZI|nr:hypothetical protein LTR37_006828 [Vermiconidia calcicola]
MALDQGCCAVDMDVYGVFQFCAIAILAAPVTVRLSSTYFNNPGRNTIFAWSILILAGLLSLTVEFYRLGTHPCTHNDFGDPISPGNFTYGHAMCGLVCHPDNPQSPIRGGSSDNIFVIPVPEKFGFDMAILFAAACCIPAILLLISMWMQILEMNWKTVHRDDDVGEMKDSNKLVELIRKYLEVPLFGGAVLVILIVGERNLFSEEVRYQTEPLANIGQWGPIVGTGLAVLGSGYLLLAEAMDQEAIREANRGRRSSMFTLGDGGDTPLLRRVARVMNKLSSYVSNPAHERFDITDFQQGQATDFPEIPGETHRNRDLSRIRSGYSQRHESEGSIRSGISRTRSRTGSFRSVSSEACVEGAAIPPMSKPTKRRDTLEVPGSPTSRPHHNSFPRNSLSNHETSSTTPTTEAQSPPAIVVSDNAGSCDSAPPQSPVLETLSPISIPEPPLAPVVAIKQSP